MASVAYVVVSQHVADVACGSELLCSQPRMLLQAGVQFVSLIVASCSMASLALVSPCVINLTYLGKLVSSLVTRDVSCHVTNLTFDMVSQHHACHIVASWHMASLAPCGELLHSHPRVSW